MPSGQEFLQRVVSSGDPQGFMDAHQGELDPELARDLKDLAGQALRAGAFDYATVAGSLAGSVYLRIGLKPEALICNVLSVQGRFQAATTVPEYREVRAQFLEAEQRAASVEGAEQARFEARGFAAQCGYFACEAADSPEPAETLIRESLEDVIALLNDPRLPDRVPMFMAFAYPTLDLATNRLWLDEDGRIEAALGRIATLVEASIPAEAQLSDDPSRDAGMAEVLARLAARHAA